MTVPTDRSRVGWHPPNTTGEHGRTTGSTQGAKECQNFLPFGQECPKTHVEALETIIQWLRGAVDYRIRLGGSKFKARQIILSTINFVHFFLSFQFLNNFFSSLACSPLFSLLILYSLRSRRLEVVGTRKNRREKKTRDTTRVTSSRVSVLSFARYFQAPATQANSLTLREDFPITNFE